MFRSFFAALANLTTNVNTLAASFAEANENFRRSLALDHAEDVPALPAPPEPEEEPVKRNGRTRKAAV